MMSHRNIVAATSSINRYLRNSSSDVILNVLPLSFDYGLYQLFLASQSGASVVLERSFAYPAPLLDLMEREHVTALPIVPMIAALILRYDLRATGLSSLRYITNTGAVLPPAHIEALRQRLPHVRVFSIYGLTECKRVSFLAPDEIDRRPTSVGKPMDNVEVFLVDSEGSRLDHGVGELVVRGANVMQGYWRAPDDTARVLRPGALPDERVLHTGDIFRIDKDGFMYLSASARRCHQEPRAKVSPREVEDVLHAVPGVVEALAVGVPDAILGEAVKGYVTVAPGVLTSEREILSHCAKHLEDFMVPRSIEIVSELPHNDSGKLARASVQTSPARSVSPSRQGAEAYGQLVASRHSMARNVILVAVVGLAIVFAHRQALAAMVSLWMASPMYSVRCHCSSDQRLFALDATGGTVAVDAASIPGGGGSSDAPRGLVVYCCASRRRSGARSAGVSRVTDGRRDSALWIRLPQSRLGRARIPATDDPDLGRPHRKSARTLSVAFGRDRHVAAAERRCSSSS